MCLARQIGHADELFVKWACMIESDRSPFLPRLAEGGNRLKASEIPFIYPSEFRQLVGALLRLDVSYRY